jgi:hypothetical protein
VVFIAITTKIEAGLKKPGTIVNKKYLLFFPGNESFLSSNVDRENLLVFEEVNNGSES